MKLLRTSAQVATVTGGALVARSVFVAWDGVQTSDSPELLAATCFTVAVVLATAFQLDGRRAICPGVSVAVASCCIGWLFNYPPVPEAAFDPVFIRSLHHGPDLFGTTCVLVPVVCGILVAGIVGAVIIQSPPASRHGNQQTVAGRSFQIAVSCVLFSHCHNLANRYGPSGRCTRAASRSLRCFCIDTTGCFADSPHSQPRNRTRT